MIRQKKNVLIEKNLSIFKHSFLQNFSNTEFCKRTGSISSNQVSINTFSFIQFLLYFKNYSVRTISMRFLDRNPNSPEMLKRANRNDSYQSF